MINKHSMKTRFKWQKFWNACDENERSGSVNTVKENNMANNDIIYFCCRRLGSNVCNMLYITVVSAEKIRRFW